MIQKATVSTSVILLLTLLAGCNGDSALPEATLLEPSSPRPVRTETIPPPPDRCVEAISGGCLDGEPCQSDSECAGGSCLSPDRYPNGHCTTLSCATEEDCTQSDALTSQCLVNEKGINSCVRSCAQDADCRAGYACEVLEDEAGYCAPNIAFQSRLTAETIENYPVPITCYDVTTTDAVAIPFEVDQDTDSFLFAPFTLDGSRIESFGLKFPNGEELAFAGSSEFLAFSSSAFGVVSPIVIPPPKAAGRHDAHPGRYRYILKTKAPQVCAYLMTERTSGTTLDLNIYPVGLLSGEDVDEESRFDATLAHLREIMKPIGVRIGEVRIMELDAEVQQRFSVITQPWQLGALSSTSRPPEESVDGVLSMNVFVVRRIGTGGVIGISRGLPGPAALHGFEHSGVIVTGQFMGVTLNGPGDSRLDGDLFTAQAIAHEIGHYMGLFHTTQTNQKTGDPLEDTPSCIGETFPNGCPDATNLMFPLALPLGTELSDEQVGILKTNPLTREANGD